MKQEYFGKTTTGEIITKYILQNDRGMEVHVLNYGAVIQSLLVPDAHGKITDTVLGYDTVADYEKDTYFVGCLVGRNANRIKGAKVTIDDKTYQLEANDGNNSLHGGSDFFGKKVWNARVEGHKLVLSYLSKDGENGFPGNVNTHISFSLEEDNTLSMELVATTDAPTIINLTRHEYFNFVQHTGNTVYDHILRINADRYTQKALDGLPDGEIKRVAGTALDLTEAKPIGHQAAQLKPGFDHNYVLNNRDENTLTAVLTAPDEALTMEIHSTQPGLQCYDAHAVTAFEGKSGIVKAPGSGVCLEPQFFPDTPNHPDFPSTIFRPGQPFEHSIKYRFI